MGIGRLPIKKKSLPLTVFLATILCGSGHLYLGFTIKGLFYLLCGICFSIVAFTFPPPVTLVILFVWWIIQLVDAIWCQRALDAAWQRQQFMGYRK